MGMGMGMAATATATASTALPAGISPTSVSDLPPRRPLPSNARHPRRRTREVYSRYLSAPLLPPSPSPRLSSSSSFSCYSSTSSPRARHRSPTPFADENTSPPMSSISACRESVVVNLFDEMSSPTHLQTSTPTPFVFAAGVTSVATSMKHRSSSTWATSAAAPHSRGYPRPSTPAHCRSCPRPSTPLRTRSDFSRASFTVSDVAEGADMGGAATLPTPCQSPIFGLVTSRGRGTVSELQSLIPKRARPMQALNSLCRPSFSSSLSNSQGAVEKVALTKPPQSPRLKVKEPMMKMGPVVGRRKASGRQEDAHQLRMKENCYVQYRFLNAQAEVVGNAKNAMAKKSLYGMSKRIAGLRGSIAEKKAELELLKKVEKVCSIAGSQGPYLEQWSGLEGNHASCLTKASTALHEASSRLPIYGNVSVDIREITEAFDCALQILEPLSPCVGSFLPKVGETGDLASKVVKVIGDKRHLIEECKDLLDQAHKMQMKECSLRCQLLQLQERKAS